MELVSLSCVDAKALLAITKNAADPDVRGHAGRV